MEMERLDRESVRALELKAPGACQKESRELYGRVRSGDVLGAFTVAERERIWSRICSATTENLIPSLYGFFEDLKYIKLAADCMKRLVRIEGKDTIRSTLENAYCSEDQRTENFLIQVSGPAMKLVRANGTDFFDVSYRQLWLYAIREHACMPAEVKRKKSGANAAHADEAVLFQFASLAHKLGFRSDEIGDILRRNPDREIARRLLTMARKPEQFHYEDIESCITMIEGVIAGARPVQNENIANDFMVEDDGKPPSRSGPPAVVDMARDKPSMYLDVLHGAFRRQDPNLTSLFIQRSRYFAFFGKDIDLSMDNVNAAQDQEGPVYGNLEVEHNTNNQLIHSSAFTQVEPERRVTEEEHQRRLVDLLSRVAETESQLELLEQRKVERLGIIEQLQSTITTKENNLQASRREEDEIQERLHGLQRTEADQVIRLERLQNDVQDRQSRIDELGGRRTNLDEEIRLDLVSANRQNQNDEEEQRIRLLQLSEQAIEKQNSVNQLTALHRQTQQETQRLEEERQRLESAVDELTVKKSQLVEEEQAKAVSIASAESEAKSVVDRLSAKELELRQNIDHLEICLRALQTKINDAVEDEMELQSRVQRLEAMGRHMTESGGEHDGTKEGQVERRRIGVGPMVRRALHNEEESILEEPDGVSTSPVGATASEAGAMILRAGLVSVILCFVALNPTLIRSRILNKCVLNSSNLRMESGG